MFQKLFPAALLAIVTWGQTTVDLKTQTRRMDFSAAVHTKPIQVGAALPVTCELGEMFFRSTDAPGSNLYGCTVANTWTQLAGGGGGGGGSESYAPGVGITIVGNTIAADDAVLPQYFTGSSAPTIDCEEGRDYYVDSTNGRFYFCKSAGSWQALSPEPHQHNAAAITAGIVDPARLPAEMVRTDAANTYGAGIRQTFAHSGAAAGLRLLPGAGDPASAQDGDLWYNASSGKFRMRQGGVSSDFGGGAGGGLDMLDQTVLSEFEDFIWGATSISGYAFKLGWATLGTFASVQVPGHPGVVSLGPVNKNDGSSSQITLANDISYTTVLGAGLTFEYNWEMRFLFRMKQSANVLYRIGVGRTAYYNQFLGLEFDSSVQNTPRWACYGRYVNSDLSTPDGSMWFEISVKATSPKHYQLKARTNGGPWGAAITACDSGCDLSTADMNSYDEVYFQVSNRGASSVDNKLEVDRWAISMNNLAR
jgi:hypothetical protein